MPCNFRRLLNGVVTRDTVGAGVCQGCIAFVGICIGGILGFRSGSRLDIFGGRDDLAIKLYFAIKSLIESILSCAIWRAGVCFFCTLGGDANKGDRGCGGFSTLGTGANIGALANVSLHLV